MLRNAVFWSLWRGRREHALEAWSYRCFSQCQDSISMPVTVTLALVRTVTEVVEDLTSKSGATVPAVGQEKG